LRDVVGLPLGEAKSDGIAEGVHENVNLCGGASPRSTDGLRSVFFSAPVASWCARTIVASMM
jgi:hypothetical protein